MNEKVKYTTDDFAGHVKVTISAKEVRVSVCDEKGCQFRFKAMGKVEKSGGIDVKDVVVVADDALLKACEKASWMNAHILTRDKPDWLKQIEAALELEKKGE